MSHGRQVLLLAALVLLAMGGWWAADRMNLLQAAAPDSGSQRGGSMGRGGAGGFAAPVITAPVGTSDDRILVQAAGTGHAASAVTIHPAAAGEVMELTFDAGRPVARGDVLLHLDDEEARLAVGLARVEVRDAEVTLNRFRKVASTGAVSAAEVDVARTALERARLRLEEAERALRQRVVLAPFDGVPGLPMVDPGDRVTTTTAIVTLDDRSRIYVTFDLPEIHAEHLRPGMAIKVVPWSLRGQSFDGIVDSLDSRIDPVSRSLQVRAMVDNAQDLLRPGMSFAIELEVAGAAYDTVPEIAVMWSREGSYVWRVRPDADATGTARPGVDAMLAERVPVRIQRRERDRVLVEGALDPGDRIVVEGMQRLREGAAVRLAEPEPAPDGGAGPGSRGT